MKLPAALILLACFGLLLAGCQSAFTWNPAASEYPGLAANGSASGGYYTVAPGDTLYSIAWRYNLDYHDLAAWNGINTSYTIYPGQHLRLNPSGSSAKRQHGVTDTTPQTYESDFPTVSNIQWHWPAGGRVITEFRQNGRLNKGIDITGSVGAAVQAAADGEVVYTGSGLIGYGKLIIIKHSEHFLSAYADNESILVREGDKVKVGEQIAYMGTGRDQHAILHFEIRYNGKPVNPLRYLPKR